MATRSYWIPELHDDQGNTLAPPLYATNCGRETLDILRAQAFEDFDCCMRFCATLSRRTLKCWAAEEHIWEI